MLISFKTATQTSFELASKQTEHDIAGASKKLSKAHSTKATQNVCHNTNIAEQLKK
jgi:hypothetical protein